MPTEAQNRIILEDGLKGKSWEYPHEIAAEFDRLNAEIEALKANIALLERIVNRPPDGERRDWITSPAPRDTDPVTYTSWTDVVIRNGTP